MTDLQTLRDWLDRYEIAWRSNESDLVEALFTDEAVYRWHPWDQEGQLARGSEAIAQAWLAEPDAPGSWDLAAVALAVNEDLGVARCVTRYRATPTEPERTYHNIFLVQLDPDGRCSDFTEFFMLEPADPRELG
jgi:SnoaL-like domain